MQQAPRDDDGDSQAQGRSGATTQPSKSPGRRNTPKPYGPSGSKSQGAYGNKKPAYKPGMQNAKGAYKPGGAPARRPPYGQGGMGRGPANLPAGLWLDLCLDVWLRN